MNNELFFSNEVDYFIDHYQLKECNSYAIMMLASRCP